MAKAQQPVTEPVELYDRTTGLILGRYPNRVEGNAAKAAGPAGHDLTVRKATDDATA